MRRKTTTFKALAPLSLPATGNATAFQVRQAYERLFGRELKGITYVAAGKEICAALGNDEGVAYILKEKNDANLPSPLETYAKAARDKAFLERQSDEAAVRRAYENYFDRDFTAEDTYEHARICLVDSLGLANAMTKILAERVKIG